MEFGDAVRRRRSVRRFADRPIPEEVLTEILEAGRLAPSGGNRQGFHFGVVTDGALRRELAGAAGGQDWIATAPVVIAYCVELSADLATLPPDDFAMQVNRDRFGQEFLDSVNALPDRATTRTLWDNGAALIPGEHVHLAAAAHGLGSCWVGHLDIRRAGAVLGLPDDMVCLYLMPVGYPAEEPGEVSRRSLAECVFHDRWA
ncbi:MAG: nitroreductase family protein [Actinomycetales bacterium]|nr:nitroreductase family protein [Actinomycetales bacterium]